jgi:DNA-binding transcriptional ArsR family regulator
VLLTHRESRRIAREAWQEDTAPTDGCMTVDIAFVPQSPLKTKLSTSLDRTLAALANPSRRFVVKLLGERPCRAGELAAGARISFPAMSRHLRTLRRSGLVEETRDELDSRVRVYQLRDGPIEELRTWLAETWTQRKRRLHREPSGGGES